MVQFRYPKPRFFPPTVKSQIERKQLRWLGHLARREPFRVPLIMLSAVRRGDSHDQGRHLLNHYLCGQGGVYEKLIVKYYTPANIKTFFSTVKVEGRRLLPWAAAAQHRALWGAFASEAPGIQSGA